MLTCARHYLADEAFGYLKRVSYSRRLLAPGFGVKSGDEEVIFVYWR